MTYVDSNPTTNNEQRPHTQTMPNVGALQLRPYATNAVSQKRRLPNLLTGTETFHGILATLCEGEQQGHTAKEQRTTEDE